MCSFDTYSSQETSECNGLSIDYTNSARFTSLDADLLPGSNSIYVTDFTSIARKTETNKNCNIPFTYNNASSYFCVLKNSLFSCEVDKLNMMYDACTLGKRF